MQTFQTVPQTILREIAHFGFCAFKIGFFRGVGGVPDFFFSIAIFIVLKSYDTPLLGLNNGGEKIR